MTIIRRMDSAFSGGNSDTLPVFTPGPGLSGAVHRWVAAEQSGTDLTAVSANKGGLDLTTTSLDTRPKLTTVFGVKAVTHDGVDDILYPVGALASNIQTMVLIARVTGPNTVEQGVLNSGGNYLTATVGTPPVLKGFSAGGTTVFSAKDPSQPLFHVIALIGNAATRAFYIDGEYKALNGTGQNTNLNIGRGSTSGYGKLDWLECTTFASALSLADLDKLRAAAKINYRTLIA